MRRYTVTPLAKADLREIFRYIAKDNLPAAERLLEQLHDRFAQVARNPQSGELRPSIGEGVRSVSVGNYVIIFRPNKKKLQIVRVIHGARDIETIFRKSES